jgi:hypothetical protein
VVVGGLARWGGAGGVIEVEASYCRTLDVRRRVAVVCFGRVAALRVHVQGQHLRLRQH